MKNIETELLRTLLVLLRERSVSKAAVRLQLSQPAVSQALGKLRVFFNDPLLVRAKGGMVPTERALQVGKELSSVLDRLDSLSAASALFEPTSSTRTFSLTTSAYAELVLGPTLAGVVSAAAPNVQVEFRRPDPNRANDLLERGELDFRIAWVRGNTSPSSMRSKALFEDRFVCIARVGHPTIQGSITVQQFLAAPQVCTRLQEGITLARVVDEAIRRLPAELPTGVQVQNYLTLPFFVANSDFVVMAPLRVASAFQSSLGLQILESPLRLPRIRYAVYWHERSQRDAGHRWMRQRIAEAVDILETRKVLSRSPE
ncbi:MAG: LysR family transcriptional regulator [Pseudomonadota bacterium]